MEDTYYLWLRVDIHPSNHQVPELWRSAAQAAASKLSLATSVGLCQKVTNQKLTDLQGG